MIKEDAIIGHQQAIANLEQSIAERNKLFASVKYLRPEFRLAMNRIHLKEIENLEILKLELQRMDYD